MSSSMNASRQPMVKARWPELALAVVKDLQVARAPATAEGLEALETDVPAGFVLARAAAGLSDGTISSDVVHLEQVRAWFGRPLREMESADADAYFGKVLRATAKGTRRRPAGVDRRAVPAHRRRRYPLLRAVSRRPALDISIERVAEVLTEMSVLNDDRRPFFETWLERKLDGLADGIGAETEHWVRVLHQGGPRAKAREPDTVRTHLSNVPPTLLTWSQCYGHLREVTREDVLAALDDLTGSRRNQLLITDLLKLVNAICLAVEQEPDGAAQADRLLSPALTGAHPAGETTGRNM
ncbi:hypothetical protein [Streptosporangium canum]|uniref:hypothetical protein n=1 Tax=Streptosporangium canum TaxID=324952 RepID=UPI0037A7554C